MKQLTYVRVWIGNVGMLGRQHSGRHHSSALFSSTMKAVMRGIIAPTSEVSFYFLFLFFSFSRYLSFLAGGGCDWEEASTHLHTSSGKRRGEKCIGRMSSMGSNRAQLSYRTYVSPSTWPSYRTLSCYPSTSRASRVTLSFAWQSLWASSSGFSRSAV